jgi:hypothetical protein
MCFIAVMDVAKTELQGFKGGTQTAGRRQLNLRYAYDI